jgi:serine/threonine protein kinase
MPSDSLPLSVLQRIDQVCDAFEGAWRAGEGPRIEDFLEPEIEPEGELFRELLAREIELRREAGEVVDPAQYEGRFQRFQELIRTLLNDVSPGPAETAVFLSSLRQSAQAGLPVEDLDRTDADTMLGLLDVGASPRHLLAESELPERIGRFRPIRLIGQGNFLVFQAVDEATGREVALKVARPDDPFSRRRLTSLVEEAQRLAALEHPGIVKVLEFVVPTGPRSENPAGGEGFIVLEYIEGPTLESLLALPDLMSRPRLVRIVAAVAEAVQHAHTTGLVHRDLKPSNILIDRRDEPRVCDFGLAVNENLQRLSKGEVAGTLYYMAPEQVRGETNRLDGRTDIWALGVILYRGLTGRLPFWGSNPTECFDEILNREPRPPRQFGSVIPAQLERICLRCLSKLTSDRYLTAADLAADLRRWLSQANREPLAEPGTPASPKGLRTFGSEDAGSFLSLLPGPRGSDGLPESIRFWKARIEDPEGLDTFSVGLVYGPSGGGKSSFVRAGLLPQLDRMEVRPVYLEASPSGTEARLLAELRRLIPRLPREGGLAEAVALLRDDPQMRPREKLLLVIDQFEQWLQGRPIESATEMVLALRQCDGRAVQVLLVVRDDYWMAITRLFHAVEVPLVEGRNTRAVELFDARHARKVLEEFGRSLGQIASVELAAGDPAGAFLDQAIAGLASTDGRIIPVRLSLFVEVVRHRPWRPETLGELGGIHGIEIKFLEGAFDTPTAPPAHLLHRSAAEAVLKLLLPPAGTNLRGSPASVGAIREASGYADRPRDFADLIQVLERDLRLISVVEGRAGCPIEHAQPAARLPSESAPQPSFQLAHEYLISPVRHWLQRHLIATRAGRARLRLEAITASWLARPSPQRLPSALEYLGILSSTSSHDWTRDERRLMRSATWYHARRLALAVCVVALLIALSRAVIQSLETSSAVESAFVANQSN